MYKKKFKRRGELKDFHLIKETVGVMLDGVWVKDDGTEIIIRSPFFGDRYLHFKPLSEAENSL